jgi:hypothetical protein
VRKENRRTGLTFAPTASSRSRRRRTSGDGRGDTEEGALTAPWSLMLAPFAARARGAVAGGRGPPALVSSSPRSLARFARRAALPWIAA